MKILVIDDEPFMCRLLLRQLAQLDYHEVEAFQSAPEALAFLHTDPAAVDVVFCDLQMPGMDGVEFVRQLVQLQFPGGLVLVSGEDWRIISTAEKLASRHHLKVMGGLQKPVAPAALAEIMQRCAAHHWQRTQAKGTPAQPRERRQYTAEELAQALDAGEIINYYQPKVALQDGAVLGVETLVRWRHPVDGLVLPDQFIDSAESGGLIDRLTQHVLEEALLQVRGWAAQGLSLQVAVNISMDNLASLDFPDQLEQLLLETGVAPTALMLEITESRVMHNPLASLDILARLRIKKIGLSIDDFGTGHSSLRQLRDIPFNELKIDGSFVQGVSQDPFARTILESSLNLAHQLGLKTVAEGVEKEADWHYLKQAGCDVAQGWLIARAMPAEQLPEWATQWQTRRQQLNQP